MARVSPISFSLIFIAIVSFSSYSTLAFPFLQDPSPKNPIINAYAGSSGVIDIRKDSDGLYIEADLQSYSSAVEKSHAPTTLSEDTVRMMISLSSNASMVSLRCLNFTDYDCLKYDCCATSPQAEVSYPFFIASAMVGEGPIFLDKKYWVLTENSPLYLAKSCQADSYIGFSRYGVLGFGTNVSGGSFKVSKKFSVYIKPDLNSGKLIFTDDKSSYTNSSNPLYSLPANTTWQVTIPRGYVEVANYSVAFDNYNIIFDIHTDNIGLPSDLYNLVISYVVQSRPGINCTDAQAEPSCSMPGSVQDLPDILLSFNNTKIRIPREVYIIPDQNEDKSLSYFYFNLKATDPSLSGTSYVSPAFENSIILDARFMSAYFTVFDATSGNNVIHLYPAGAKDGSEPTHWIAIGVVAVIFLVIIGYFAKRKTDGSVNKNTNTNVTNTTQEPLVYNYPSYSGNQQSKETNY